MQKTKKLIIFGTGEIGELAHYYFQHDSEYEICGFVADDNFVTESAFRGLPLVKLSEAVSRFPVSEYEAHVALSYRKLNQIREEKYKAMKALGYTMASYVCSRSVYWPDLSIGDNCFILENQTIQPTVTIGNNVMIWSGNHLGHGCSIGDHTYISSHVCISGHTEIGTHCFFGVNSATKDFAKIGNRVFITMGALIVTDIADDAVILGAKSTVLEGLEQSAIKIKSKYFGL